jgi:hypothetical protein
MRRFSKVVRSRAGLILGSAVVTMLLLPVAAFAGGFAAPSGVHHPAATGGGGSGDLAIFLAVVGVAVVCVVILGLVGDKRETKPAAKSIRRKPASAAS